MAWPYLSATIKIIVEITWDGQLAINVHFARVQGGGDVTTTHLQDAANAVRDAYATYWAGNASNAAEVTDVYAIDWSEPAGAIRYTTGTVPVVGVEVSQQVPNNVALCVTKKSNFTGRSKRGRSYIAGLTEIDCDGNQADATYVSNLLDLMADIDDNLDTAGLFFIVYSLYENNAPRTVPLQTTITGFSANDRVDTQRRRLPNS